jgi:transmembrane sensor
MTEHKNIIPDYDLLAKYFAGDASTTQIKAIENWVEENPANKKSYDQMHFLWMQSAKTELEKKVNVTDAWTKMQFRMNAAKQPLETELKAEETSIYKRTIKRLLQFAAIIVIALGVNFLLKLVNSEPEYLSTESQLSSVEITLPDNSEIKLNKESKISYPEKFKGKQRHIKLEGEAFFEVEPDKEKPFVIDVQFAQIKVVGTSFNVQAYNDDVVEVTVVSGVVELSNKVEGAEPITLRKGEKGTIEKGKKVPVLEVNEVEDELHWMTKKLIFKDMELYQVAETLSLAYNVEIVFENESLKNCKWTIEIADSSIEEIMDILRNSFTNLEIKQTDNKFTIDGTACQ